jgi:hypothetical protein
LCAFFVAMSDVDVPPISALPTTMQAPQLIDVNETIGNVHGSTPLPVSESAAHGDAHPKSTTSILDSAPESAHGILESLFEGNSAPLVRAIDLRLRRLQRTDLQSMNEIALKVGVIAVLHSALERTETDHETKQETKDERAEAIHTCEHDADRNRFRYYLQSESEARRRDAETGCDKLGFIDLVIQRIDARVPLSSANHRIAMIIELKYLPLTAWITDPSVRCFERQFFMHPVEQGMELERRKALHLASDEPIFLAQRFERLDSDNKEFKRLCTSSAFNAVTCTKSKTDRFDKDACILPVSAWLELARLQAASYRLIQAPACPVLRWAIVAVGSRVFAATADDVTHRSAPGQSDHYDHESALSVAREWLMRRGRISADFGNARSSNTEPPH